ncbi:MAG: citrate (Si)-synthase, partial [Gammaproteobacteria bacterium]|nr:citrate (Si)-synthase [Gammaproteobacteria bacterium]
MSKETETVTITDNTTGKQVTLPMYTPTAGPKVIDIGKLYKELGYFTYDPGFMSTASCSSAITFLDGGKGVLQYRGYPIEQLAEHSSYLEVCFLLLNDRLPQKDELDYFITTVTRHTMLHEAMIRFFSGFRRDAHPMAIMVGCVGALAAFYHDHMDIHDEEHRMITAYRLIAKMPTIAAMSYRYANGKP